MPQRVRASDPAATALKTVDVIESLAASPRGLGLGDITRGLGTGRSSALRILAALESRRLVVRDGRERRYRLTLRPLEWGARILAGLELPEVARPHLESLSRASGETAHLGVLDGWHVVYVAKVESQNPVRLHARVGLRAPSHCTALGKVLLAGLGGGGLDAFLSDYSLEAKTEQTITDAAEFVRHLRLVARRGYATDEQEHRTGICCVGAPVRDHEGHVVAAVSVSGPVFRMEGGRLSELAGLVVEAGEDVSRDLGWTRSAAGVVE